MSWIALKMLTGDRNKFLGIVFGVMFASLLISHQISIFVGVMKRTTSQICDVRDADIWVMDPKVRLYDEVHPLLETDLNRVRGVEGVAWAVRLYKGPLRVRRADGLYRNSIVMGVDEVSLIGVPPEMILGQIEDLRLPDAVIIDKAGYCLLWPDEPLALGKTLEINERRAVVVGICDAARPFLTVPLVYTRYNKAMQYTLPERNRVSFVVAKGDGTASPEVICQRIRAATGLQAVTRTGFSWMTVDFYLQHSGIPINFGITITLGFIVGLAIAGQTFFMFTVENLKQFGGLKAMGVSNARLVGMILLQALVVGVIGYALGVGASALFFESTKHMVHLAGFVIPWQVLVGTALPVLLIVLLSSLLSIRRVLVLEPAIVFRT